MTRVINPSQMYCTNVLSYSTHPLKPQTLIHKNKSVHPLTSSQLEFWEFWQYMLIIGQPWHISYMPLSQKTIDEFNYFRQRNRWCHTLSIIEWSVHLLANTRPVSYVCKWCMTYKNMINDTGKCKFMQYMVSQLLKFNSSLLFSNQIGFDNKRINLNLHCDSWQLINNLMIDGLLVRLEWSRVQFAIIYYTPSSKSTLSVV